MNLYSRSLLLAALASISLLCARPARAQTDILFVGNSFTYGHNEPVMSYNNSGVSDPLGTHYGGVAGIFKNLTNLAGLSYNVTIVANAGETLAGHYSGKQNIIGQSLWDIVVLQENSTYPLPSNRGGNLNSFLSAADNIQNLVLSKNPAASLILYETWASPTTAGSNGYGSGVVGLHAMQDDLQDGYYKAYYDYGFNGVARVGDSFLRAVDQGIADPNPSDGISPGMINLWNTDNRHAGVYGSYLAAAVLFGKITQYDTTLLGYTGSAAAALGIPETAFTKMNLIAREINLLADPDPAPPPAPQPATLNTLKAGTNLNWNSAANWDHALVSTDAVLINSSSAAISQVANSLDGNGHAPSIQTLSFNIGADTKTIQPNLTTQNPRTLTLTGGTDALGGTDLVHLGATTTGTAGIGMNTGFSTLTVNLATNGSFNVENALGTLIFGTSSVIAGNVNLTKKGAGRLVLSGVNTFGGTGKKFTVGAGTVLANTAASGNNSATGAGSVEVMGGAVLGGSGQITPGAGNQVVVRSGGIITPGSDGVGTLTVNGFLTSQPVLVMEAGARFVFELSNSSNDRISLSNDAAVGGIGFGGNAIDFVDLALGTLNPGSYILFSAIRSDNYQNLTLDENGFVLDGLHIGSGLENYSSSLQLVGNDIVLHTTAIPEPSTIALLALGSTAFFVWRRRQDATLS